MLELDQHFKGHFFSNYKFSLLVKTEIKKEREDCMMCVRLFSFFFPFFFLLVPGRQHIM